jgi:hypothetical protein
MESGAGYNELHFFKGNKKDRPCDGCKSEFQDTFKKDVFRFFEPLRAAKFAKSANMT